MAASALPALGPTAVRMVASGDALIPGTKVPGFYLKAFATRLVFWKFYAASNPGSQKRDLGHPALCLVWFSGSLYCLQSQRPRNRRSFDCARYTCSAQDDIGGGVEGYGISFRKLLPQSSLRSIHVGFSPSISASFFERFQPFSCFSRAIALLGEVWRSNHTNRLQRYCAAKPEIFPSLCSTTRRSKSLVIPM